MVTFPVYSCGNTQKSRENGASIPALGISDNGEP